MKKEYHKYIRWASLAAILAYLLIAAVQAGADIRAYDFYEGDWLQAFWDEVLDNLFGIGALVLLPIAWLVGEGMICLSKNGEKGKNGVAVWMNSLFAVSWLPAVFTIAASIYAGFCGFNAGIITPYYVHGLEAVWSALFWYLLAGTITMIFPVCLLIQIVFLLLRRKAVRQMQGENH